MKIRSRPKTFSKLLLKLFTTSVVASAFISAPARSANDPELTLGPTLQEQMSAMDASLRAVGAKDSVSLLYYPEFIQFHRHFKDLPPSAHGHFYDLDFLKSLLPDSSYKTLTELSSHAIGSGTLLVILVSPLISDRYSLCLADAAYLTFLMNIKGIEREAAIKLSLNSALQFKDLFNHLGKEDFQAELGNAAEVTAAFGDSARSFIERKIQTFGPQQMDDVGQSVEQLFQQFKRWKESQLRADHLEKVQVTPMKCKLALRPRS